MGKWLYFDIDNKEYFELSSMDLTEESAIKTSPFGMHSTISYGSSRVSEFTVSSSGVSISYVKQLLEDSFSRDGSMKYKKDIVRNIVLMSESGRVIELNGCMLKYTNFGEDFLESNSSSIIIELTFSVDYHVEHIDGTDAYYSTLRKLRTQKLDNLLD